MTDKKTTELYSSNVDKVVLEYLNNREFLKPARNEDFIKIIIAKLNCSPAIAVCYIKDARRIVNRLGKEKKETAVINAIRDREYIIKSAMEDKDHKLALQAMESRDKLRGLFAGEDKPKGTPLKDFDVAKLTDEQLALLKRKIKRNENVEEYLKLLGLL